MSMKIISYDPQKIITDKNIRQVELNYLLKIQIIYLYIQVIRK